jgi:hypothetical protein
MSFGQSVKICSSDVEQGRLPLDRFRPISGLQNPIEKIPLNRVRKGRLQIPAPAPNPANFSETRERDNHYSVFKEAGSCEQ